MNMWVMVVTGFCLVVVLIIIVVVVFESQIQELNTRSGQYIQKDHLTAHLQTIFNTEDTVTPNAWKEALLEAKND